MRPLQRGPPLHHYPDGYGIQAKGECYVRGFMRGESIQMLADPRIELQETWIELI
jgi:hypothetical protein